MTGPSILPSDRASRLLVRLVLAVRHAERDAVGLRLHRHARVVRQRQHRRGSVMQQAHSQRPHQARPVRAGGPAGHQPTSARRTSGSHRSAAATRSRCPCRTPAACS
ncbi:hypothetical protein G5V59_11860 [Nocardioides sp. W3-2-3]|nr:hypothetical protein [Nocardioides convexus]